MIRTLTAIYLHRAGKLDARRLPVIECGMADAFRDFCRETFDVDAPLDYPPLKLVTVNSAVDLATTILFLVTAGTAEEHFERAMVRLVLEVIATEGVGAVHGLFCRGGHAPYFVEVLNRDEESRVRPPEGV